MNYLEFYLYKTGNEFRKNQCLSLWRVFDFFLMNDCFI